MKKIETKVVKSVPAAPAKKTEAPIVKAAPVVQAKIAAPQVKIVTAPA